jgi:uncharacterized protein (DUF2235 family)
MRLRPNKRIEAWARLRRRKRRQVRLREDPAPRVKRAPRTLVIILDGTLSTLEPGCETNAGLVYKLLLQNGPRADLSVYYEAGLQWDGFRQTRDIVTGRGINRQIKRAYGFLSSRYRLGDKVFLLGYSRGAFAVRSLAGVIDKVGLVCSSCSTQRIVEQAYRHYRRDPESVAAQAFKRNYALRGAEIQMIGVWDTVKALGWRAPIVWRFSQPNHEFHNHHLSDVVHHGYQALAIDETRRAFSPEMWDDQSGWGGTVEQMWFPGTHGDVGGQLNGHAESRPLSNLPLRWMLEKSGGCGMPLPEGWQAQFPSDPFAPSIGPYHGWGKLFLSRARRKVGRYGSETIHSSVLERAAQASAKRANVPA